MIQVNNVTVSFDGKKILDNLMLTIPLEGITLLSGPSGGGKTTLFRVLAGLLKPEKGWISLPGKPVLLFQEDRLFPGRTVLEQVEAVLPQGRQGEARRYLELVELSDSLDKRPRELSGGMARRTALARALAVEGDIYLLDEPFSGVDQERSLRILDRLRSLGKPVLLTGHSPALEGACNQIVTLVTSL